MKLIFKNTTELPMKIFVEPSTDEIMLKSGATLLIFENQKIELPFELHFSKNSLTVWMARGQSANFFIDDEEIQTICSQYVW